MPNRRTQPVILIVDDDPQIVDMLRLNLGSENYEVRHCDTAAKISMDSLADVRMIIVDAMRQAFTGIDLIERIKHNHMDVHLGIILCSALTNERTIIEALDAGADDCIDKPFSLRELMARVRAVLRRRAGSSVLRQTHEKDAPVRDNCLRFKSMTIDPSTYQVLIGEKDVALSRTEYALLMLLLRNRNTFLSRSEIFKEVWRNENVSNDRVVDTNISRLRKKLGDIGLYITNRSGFGYAIKDPDDPTAG